MLESAQMQSKHSRTGMFRYRSDQSKTQDAFPTTEAHSSLLGKENVVDAWNMQP